MKYNVHVYPIIRVQYQGIEANSPEEAVRIAGDLIGKAEVRLDPRPFGRTAKEAEFCDGSVNGFLVDPLDEKGEVIYDQAVRFEADGETKSQTLQESRQELADTGS